VKKTTTKDVLSGRAEYGNEKLVTTIAPALIVVLEKDAPARLVYSHSTESEWSALVEEYRGNVLWQEVVAPVLGEDDRRSTRHAERLAEAIPASLRVTD
jgi:hypothetical protein